MNFKQLIKDYASDDSTIVHCEELFGVIKQVIEVNTDSYEITHYEGDTWENIFRNNYAVAFADCIDVYDYFLYDLYPELAKWLLNNHLLSYNPNITEYIKYVAEWWQKHNEVEPLSYCDFVKQK